MELLLQHIALNHARTPRLGPAPTRGPLAHPVHTDRGALGVASVSMSGRSGSDPLCVLCFVRVFCRRDYTYRSSRSRSCSSVCIKMLRAADNVVSASTPRVQYDRPDAGRFTIDAQRALRARFAHEHLRGNSQKEFLRALASARHDPQVAPVARHANWSSPLVRAYSPSSASVAPACGGVTTVTELSAPLFMASERARRLAEGKAPYGLLMGGKTEQEMLARIKQYRLNASLPQRCRYSTCAVVGSSGILRGSSFGRAIDAHEAVFRINAAPTFGHVAAVGSRTTWRIHNSEKPFMMAATGLPELQVAICHMAWIGSCQHQAFSGAYGDTLAYINPRFYSQLYSLLGRPRDKQSPSTGLLAIALALGVCDRVSTFGFGSTGSRVTGEARKAGAAAGGNAGTVRRLPRAARGGRSCRHYWECVKWEDEAKYHDPLHTFHDWQAEERLRQLWLEAGLVVDGAQAFGAVMEATEDITDGRGSHSDRLAPISIPLRNDTAAALGWLKVRRQWSRDLRALQRARDARRGKGIGPGQGEFVETTADLLARHGGRNASSGAQHQLNERGIRRMGRAAGTTMSIGKLSRKKAQGFSGKAGRRGANFGGGTETASQPLRRHNRTRSRGQAPVSKVSSGRRSVHAARRIVQQ